jgi:cyclase
MKSHPAFYRYTEVLKERARSLRKDCTPAEDLMWQILRNRKVLNCKFKRQQPLGGFIVDFYCHEALLVVELDGSIHDLDHIKKRDAWREAKIVAMGMTVIRFTNERVFSEADRVVEEIGRHLQANALTLNPSPGEREIEPLG